MRGGDVHDRARQDLRDFGASEEQLDMMAPRAEGVTANGFAVWPENWPAWQAYLRVQTQWVQSFSGPSGLDYVRASKGLELAGIAVTEDLFMKLQLIEHGVLETLSKKEGGKR